MKVVAFNGSPRKNGNTFLLLNMVLKEIAAEGIETKLIQLGNQPLRGCIGCLRCQEKQNQQCILNDDMFKRKVGAAVVAVRRGGATTVFSSINYFFLISQMIVPGSSYWNEGIGLAAGDVEHDEEGKRTMANLGKNMAWLIKRVSRHVLSYDLGE